MTKRVRPCTVCRSCKTCKGMPLMRKLRQVRPRHIWQAVRCEEGLGKQEDNCELMATSFTIIRSLVRN
eukprot:4654535-Amphidinium_carterae.1